MANFDRPVLKTKLHIIHCVESYYPALGGMPEVVKQLSERLVKMGHKVNVFTRFHEQRGNGDMNGVQIRQFRIEGNPRIASEPEEQRYISELIGCDADVVTFFAAQQWATDLALPHLQKIGAKKVSVPTGYSGLFDPEFRQYFENMKSLIHGYDMNVYLSNDYRDINFARENGVSRVQVIPNGAAEDEFLAPMKTDVREKLGLRKGSLLLLHVGSFTGAKGQMDAIKIFLNSGVRRATLLLLGNGYEPSQYYFLKSKRYWPLRLKAAFMGNRVIFTSQNREFTVCAYRQSDIFVFPSNIECSPIVLFECAAAALPFMSTRVGNAAEIADWTGGGMIMPTRINDKGESYAEIKGSAKLLTRLVKDKGLRKSMGEKAQSIWRQHFTWEKISNRYELLYLKLVNGNS